MVYLSKIQTKFFFVFFPFFLELWETNSFRYTFYFFFLVANFQPKLFKTQIGDPNPNYVICISSVKYKQKMQNKTKKTKAEILLFFSFRLILALMEMCSRSSWLSLVVHTIRKVKFLSKNSILTKSPTFSRVFHPKFFWQFFSWNQSCQQLKSPKTQHFHEFFTQKIDNFHGKSKLNFWTKMKNSNSVI